jgi:hypothetical protein
LAVEDVDHTRTKTKSPQTNGICERSVKRHEPGRAEQRVDFVLGDAGRRQPRRSVLRLDVDGLALDHQARRLGLQRPQSLQALLRRQLGDLLIQGQGHVDLAALAPAPGLTVDQPELGRADIRREMLGVGAIEDRDSAERLTPIRIDPDGAFTIRAGRGGLYRIIRPAGLSRLEQVA